MHRPTVELITNQELCQPNLIYWVYGSS